MAVGVRVTGGSQWVCDVSGELGAQIGDARV